MYAKQGVKAGWLLPEFMTERLKPGPEFTHALKMAYDLEYRQAYEENESDPIEIPLNGNFVWLGLRPEFLAIYGYDIRDTF